jgi:hypothetical protein
MPLVMKGVVSSVKRVADTAGETGSEEIQINACYAGKSDVNKQWCKYTPWADFKFSITNPGAMGQLLPGKEIMITIRDAEAGE